MVRISRAFARELERCGLEAAIVWHLEGNTLVFTLRPIKQTTGRQVGAALKLWSRDRGLESSEQHCREFEAALNRELTQSGVFHTIRRVTLDSVTGTQVWSVPCEGTVESEAKRLAAIIRGEDVAAAAAPQQQLHELQQEVALTLGVALETLERVHLVHRDIKPSNLFIVKRPEDPTKYHVLVADQGIMCAKGACGIAGDRGWVHPDMMDTYGEPLRDRQAIGRATNSLLDVFAGSRVLLYVLCHGSLPALVDIELPFASARALAAILRARAAAHTCAITYEKLRAFAVAVVGDIDSSGDLDGESGSPFPLKPSMQQLAAAINVAGGAAKMVAGSMSEAAAEVAKLTGLPDLHKALQDALTGAQAYTDNTQWKAAGVRSLVMHLTPVLGSWPVQQQPQQGSSSSMGGEGGGVLRLDVPVAAISNQEQQQLQQQVDAFLHLQLEQYDERCARFPWEDAVPVLCDQFDAPPELKRLLEHTLCRPSKRLSPEALLEEPYLKPHLPTFRARLPAVVAAAEEASSNMVRVMRKAQRVLDKLQPTDFSELLLEDEEEEEEGEEEEGEELSSSSQASSSSSRASSFSSSSNSGNNNAGSGSASVSAAHARLSSAAEAAAHSATTSATLSARSNSSSSNSSSQRLRSQARTRVGLPSAPSAAAFAFSNTAAGALPAIASATDNACGSSFGSDPAGSAAAAAAAAAADAAAAATKAAAAAAFAATNAASPAATASAETAAATAAAAAASAAAAAAAAAALASTSNGRRWKASPCQGTSSNGSNSLLQAVDLTSSASLASSVGHDDVTVLVTLGGLRGQQGELSLSTHQANLKQQPHQPSKLRQHWAGFKAAAKQALGADSGSPSQTLAAGAGADADTAAADDAVVVVCAASASAPSAAKCAAAAAGGDVVMQPIKKRHRRWAGFKAVATRALCGLAGTGPCVRHG